KVVSESIAGVGRTSPHPERVTGRSKTIDLIATGHEAGPARNDRPSRQSRIGDVVLPGAGDERIEGSQPLRVSRASCLEHRARSLRRALHPAVIAAAEDHNAGLRAVVR